MNSLYSNKFSITTTEAGEVFLKFCIEAPKIDDDGKIVGAETCDCVTVVMGNGSYAAFKEMLDNFAEGKKDESNH